MLPLRMTCCHGTSQHLRNVRRFLYGITNTANRPSHYCEYKYNLLLGDRIPMISVGRNEFLAPISGYKHNLNSKNFLHQSCSQKPESSVEIKLNLQLSQIFNEVVLRSPLCLRSYLELIRLDKPTGTMLLFWPSVWSIGMGTTAGMLPSPMLLAKFLAGAFLMRGAACIINDMWDRDFDKQVERTKQRPLAAGTLRMRHAALCCSLLLGGAASILFTFNWYSIILGSLSMLLVVTYPLMKRVTYWPQAFLGVTLNWGVLLGWSVTHGHLQAPAISLYLACVAFTMYYDTIYAHQDKEDDAIIGVRSTALLFGCEDSRPWLLCFASVLSVGLLTTGILTAQSTPFFIATAGLLAFHIKQINDVNLDDPDDCNRHFRLQNRVGGLMFMAILLSTLAKDPDTEELEDEPK